MKSILRSEYSKLFLLGMLLNLVAAWFSMGHNQGDEHFQILEFANYKLGHSPAIDLPWEFIDKIRPGLQPFIAYCCIGTLQFIGVHSPFIIAFLFRLGISFLSWLVVCKLVMLLLPDFKTERGRKLFVLLNLFLWFLPYLSVRFSSENTASVSFLWAIYFLLKQYKSDTLKDSAFLAIGALLSLSFFFRFQMAFAFAGLGIWLLFIKRISFKNWFFLGLSFLAVSSICIYLDKWLYGTWEFTPYNYYYFNIVKGIAAGFGTAPWWDYFATFFLVGIPPISLVLMAFLFVGVYKKPLNIFSFILIPFVVAHSLVAHKEMRFLIPMIFPFLYMVSIATDHFIATYKPRKIYTYSFKVLVVVNFLMMIYRTLIPAQDALPYFRYVHKNLQKNPTTILCLQEPLFSLYGLKMNFYKPANINELVFKDEDTLSAYVVASKEDSVIIFQRKAFLPVKLTGYASKRIYTFYPEWLLKYNINHWEDRANIWSIYVVYKKPR